jgi:hypothetical protein
MEARPPELDPPRLPAFSSTTWLVTSMRLGADGTRAFEAAHALPARLLSRLPAAARA